jgi:small subunit ribosomal protein S3
LGHKVHPTGFRLGIVKGWESRWYAGRNYKDLLAEDRKLRDAIRKRLANAGISRIEIERVAGTQIAVAIHTAKPGIVIGKSGVKVEELRRTLEAMTSKRIRVTIQEIRQPEVDAFLVARSIADQLEKRVAFRRAMKQAVQRAQRFGAKGVRVQVSGRLGGSEMSRREWDRWGRVPLHTLRADIDYGFSEAETTYGIIGIKVWVYKGDRLASGEAPTIETPTDEDKKRRPPRRDDGKPGAGRPPRGRRPDGQGAAPSAPGAPGAPGAAKRVRATKAGG